MHTCHASAWVFAFHPPAEPTHNVVGYESCFLPVRKLFSVFTALSASYKVPIGCWLPERGPANIMDEELGAAEENGQEVEAENTHPAEMESHRITILGGAPTPAPAVNIP